jgi:hypothetical protein
MGYYLKELYLSADVNPEREKASTQNRNTDVIAVMEECDDKGSTKTIKYVASFFTYDNIGQLKTRHFKTGEYLKGKYFYSKNMLLIDDCSIENVRKVVKHLMEEGEFGEVFRKL